VSPPQSTFDDADGPQRLVALLRAAEASRLAGRHAAGAEEARAALELAETCGTASQHAEALWLLGIHQLRLGAHEACIASLTECATICAALGDRIRQATAVSTSSMAYLELGLVEEALERAERGLDVAKDSGDAVVLSWAYNRAGIVHKAIDVHGEGVRALTLALDLARETGDSEAQFSALNNLCEAFVARVREDDSRPEAEREALLREAERHAEEALELARASGNAHRECIILLNYADVVLSSGEYDDGVALLKESGAIAGREGFRPLVVAVEQRLADASVARGELREAIASYKRLLASVAAIGDESMVAEFHRSLWRAHKELGEFREALEHHERHHALERRLNSQVAETRARLLANRLELEQARHEAKLQRALSGRLQAEKAELERESRALERRANQDGLTGVWNRQYVERELPRLYDEGRAAGQPLSVAIVDADHFKSINDRFGHLVGDEVLRRLARILHASVRPSDLVARIGGEEFLVALPGATEDVAAKLSERLCEAVRAGEWDNLPEGVGPTISVGVATAPSDAVGAETAALAVKALLARADGALYLAKDRGRDRVEIAAA
jgi:diguanylate cyclase (GGDEF)-like protein